MALMCWWLQMKADISISFHEKEKPAGAGRGLDSTGLNPVTVQSAGIAASLSARDALKPGAGRVPSQH
jgi:hypothetical protein